MEDRKIVTLLWQRSESALTALADRFGKRLMSTAMNILGIPQDAEEAVNDTYLAVWNTVPPKSPDPLAGYVYKTGRNISLDRLKYNTAEKRNGYYDLSIDELAECIPSAALDEQVQARELGLAINRFLATLSADDRALFLRRYWFGDQVREIAKDLGLRQNTATVRLGRLRTQLRNSLLKEGYIDE
ncbi:MAG: sigma-70 family RNA polymerase sigma factor [Oscillospiraceae bacterium]|nr:sigma-70 family RNA polymerase sigma factor [Oscillospiraceae bacterium]